MFLLPVFGLIVGFMIGNRRALGATALAAAVGFALVAALTDEIEGAGDPFVWVDTAVALVATLLGIGARRWLMRWRRRDVTSV